MTRIPLIRREDLPTEHQHIYDEIGRRRGHVGPHHQVLLNSPIAQEHLAAIGDYLRFDSGIPNQLREVIVLCVAREANSDYEWTAHERHALKAGVQESTINAIRNRSAPKGLAGDEATVARYTKELLINHKVSDESFEALRRVMGDKGLVDMTLLALWYVTMSHALLAFGVGLEPGDTSTLDTNVFI